MIGQYKGIFHSTLAQAGEVHLAIKSGVMKSKKAGKPDFIIVEHDGGGDQFLNLENERCKNALRHKKGQSITIRATGTREDADIQILNADGTAKAPEAPSARSDAQGGSGQPDASRAAAQWTAAASLAIDTVISLKDAHLPEMTPEQFQALVSGLVIYFDRRGIIEAMPVEKAAPADEEVSW